jgi:hypothetical protein
MVTKAALEAIRSRFDGRRGQAALAVYVGLVECANEARSDTVAVARGEIARRGMVNVRSVDRYASELETLGLLQVEARPLGEVKVWTLTDPAAGEGCDSESHPGGYDPQSQALRTRVAGGCDSESHPSDVKKKDKETSPDGDVEVVFESWVTATGRDKARTKLTADRRRRIVKALASHGVDDCLAAVRNIGADPWASGENDRGRPFNDIEHALGSTKRIEDWRDRTPGTAAAGRRESPSDLLSAMGAAA